MPYRPFRLPAYASYPWCSELPPTFTQCRFNLCLSPPLFALCYVVFETAARLTACFVGRAVDETRQRWEIVISYFSTLILFFSTQGSSFFIFSRIACMDFLLLLLFRLSAPLVVSGLWLDKLSDLYIYRYWPWRNRDLLQLVVQCYHALRVLS